MEEEGKDPGQLVRWPAVGLLFVGVADLVISLFLMVGGEEITRSIEEAVQREEPDFEIPMEGWTDPANLALTVLGLLISVMVVVGGAAMLNKKSWALSLIAGILAMIPCFGPCCGLFFPVGIWAVIVLMKPEVKQAMN